MKHSLQTQKFFSLTSLYIALAILIWFVLLFLELKQVENRVWLTSILVVGYWSGYLLLIQSAKSIRKKYLKWLVKLSVFLFIFNFFLNFINVYSLGMQPLVQNFCTSVTSVCTVAVKVFEITRMYRFITLSTSFLFSFVAFFIGLLVFAEQGAQLLRPSSNQKLRWIFFS